MAFIWPKYFGLDNPCDDLVDDLLFMKENIYTIMLQVYMPPFSMCKPTYGECRRGTVVLKEYLEELLNLI